MSRFYSKKVFSMTLCFLAVMLFSGVSSLYSQNYSGTDHWIGGIYEYGERIVIEDGSLWEVSIGDQYRTCRWDSNDKLIVKPNLENGTSFYNFIFYNKSIGTEARVGLLAMPNGDNNHSLTISEIDHQCATVILSDGSRWSLSDGAEACSWWTWKDPVLVGDNDGPSTWWDEYIIINLELGNYVKANLR